jgi:hypothetical protein
MKIPTDRITFEEEGYTTEAGEPLWLELPRSVREGYVYHIIDLNRQVSADENATAEDARKLVVAALQLVERWNFDDQEGNPLMVLKHCQSPDEEAHVVQEIPMEVVNRIVAKATATEDDKSTS